MVRSPRNQLATLAGIGAGQPVRVGAQPVLLSANVQTSTHPNGLPHVRSTIRKMAELARAGAESYEIRNLATRIVHDVPSKQYVAEVAALYRWVRDNIRYRKDPVRVEWVQSPARTVREQAGDCDDISTLLASLIESLGHETRFGTVGRTRDTQEHVAVEALILGNWISVDPVLEPPALSTAPRADLGRFGQRAPGARIVWNSEGTMLAGHRRARRRSLAGIVGARGRTLWDWNPYFPPVGVAQDSGFSIAAGSVAARPDSPYRADDAPGFFGNRNLRTLAAKSGQPTSPVSRPLAGLGEGWTIGQMRVTTSDVAALRNYLAKGGGWLGRYSNERPAQARLESVRARIASDDYFAAQQWATLRRDSRNWIRDHYGPPKGLEKIAQGAVKLVTKVGSSLPAKILAPVLAQNVDPKLRAIQDKVLQKIPLPQAQALRAAGGSVAQFADKVGAGRVMQVSAGKLVQKGATLAAGWKAPHAKLAAKYPRNARQVFDRAHGVFRVYVPKGQKLSGMGAVRPTISFALGANATGPSSSSSSAMATLARNAVNAVTAFTKQHGAPPQVKLPAVLALQQADAQLTDDGLWGPNAVTASAFYLGTPASQLPAVAAPYKKYAVTWRAPSSSAPAAISKPAPAPAVTTANTPKALAMNAVNAVRAFKSPPTGSVPAVLAFQRADDLLLDDGKYGPNVQLAAAYYLGVPTSTLPAFAAAFKNTKITWHAPGTAAPVASVPTPKPAAGKPASKPAAQTAQHAAPVAAPSSSSSSKPPPAPLPGYTEVGHETSNPGLAPVPAAGSSSSSSSSSAPGQHTVTTASGGKVVQLDPILITAAPPKPKKKASKAAKPTAAAPMPAGAPPSAGAPYDLPAPGAGPSGSSSAPYADTMPELGPPPIPAGSSYEQFEAAGAAQEQAASSSSSSNTLLWLAAAYFYSKHKKKRAA